MKVYVFLHTEEMFSSPHTYLWSCLMTYWVRKQIFGFILHAPLKPYDTRISKESHCCPELSEFSMQCNIYCCRTCFTSSPVPTLRGTSCPTWTCLPLLPGSRNSKWTCFQRAINQSHLKSHNPTAFPLMENFNKATKSKASTWSQAVDA